MSGSRQIGRIVRREGDAMAADIVVPVPLHRDREKERGYNQAAVISKALAKNLGLPHRPILTGQAGAQRRGTLDLSPWRFCHTSRQPS